MHGDPGVTAPIIGASNVAQLRETLKVAEMALSPEEQAACDAITGVVQDVDRRPTREDTLRRARASQ